MDLCSIQEIRPLLERHGFHFSKARGQNFLTAAWVPERIAAESRLDESCGVLEIGPGVGCLTKELARRAGRVVAVEVDKRLPDVLAESLADCDNVEIVCGDILRLDIPALVREKLPGLTPVVCANLPYNITTPVLTALLDARLFASINVMVQREVARRLCAAPDTADYGAFTIYVNYFAEPRILFDVAPGCFIPQPKVTSSVIRLVPRKTPAVPVRDEALFFRTVRAAFAQRRKTLANALAAGFPEVGKAGAADVIAACGLPPQIRGEALDLAAFARLADALAAQKNS